MSDDVWGEVASAIALLANITRRRFVSPVGVPIRPRIVTVASADRAKHLVTWNRFPRQVIGFAIRLPDMEICGGRTYHPQLSFVWSKPARWWK
ncbi:hypothetical protein SEA_BUDSKI_56 [Gordonia phage Budski]|nr:hypothetical protein SEA_BUDSKI_56 [Gordonia phage Budski]